MSTSEDPAFRRIEFDRVYSFTVGSIPVVFGRVSQQETSGPVIYAAALSERDLRHESCGYGATEAEAAADLFRLMR
jgi:hypothetical protein